MKGQPFSSASLRLDQPCLDVAEVAFLVNGPYSFALGAGECLGLSGRSGVGKSQLLRAIADLILHSGTVMLHGAKAEDMPAPRWRRLVGLVPADPCWWHDQVGPHFSGQGDQQFFLSTLARLGFGPEVLGWEIGRLSTGERQRLALVRALVVQPLVLLLDEPTSGLDSYHVGEVETLIAEVRSTRKTAVVWVSHDLEQLKRVSTLILKVEQHHLQHLSITSGIAATVPREHMRRSGTAERGSQNL